MRWAAVFFCACGALAGFTARAADAVPTWTAATAFVSQYVFRGVRVGGPAVQPWVQMEAGPLGLGVWSSVTLRDAQPGRGSAEVDPYGYYRIAVNEAVVIEPGLTWYTFPEADGNRGFRKSTLEPSLAASCTIGWVRLTPRACYDLQRRGPTWELSAAFALPLARLGTELDFTGTVGTFRLASAANTAPAVKNWGDYWLVSVAVPYQISRRSRLSLGLACTEGAGHYLQQGGAPRRRDPDAGRRGFATVGYTFTF